MRKVRCSILLVVLTAGVSATPAAASPIGVVRESGRTAAFAARDGALTVGRTIKAFFAHGSHTAKRTWQQNAALTRADTRADAERVRREARRDD